MKDRIKSGLYFLLYYSGLEFLLARLIRVRGVAVLMYHGVCERSAIPDHINFHLPPRLFERQMRVLKRRYNVIPLSKLVGDLKHGNPLAKGVVLTFDDGYKNNAQYAAPILNRLGLPFTVFVATKYVEEQSWIPLNKVYWLWSEGMISWNEMTELRKSLRSHPSNSACQILGTERKYPSVVSVAAGDSFAMLNWDEVRDMTKAGVEFGSHTHSHCNMAVESEVRQSEELQVSKELLERQLDRPISLFAYPYGRSEHMSEQSRRKVIDAGYECAISTERGLATGICDRFRMPRVGYDPRIWMFAGEILLEFVKQAARGRKSPSSGRAGVASASPEATGERHG